MSASAHNVAFMVTNPLKLFVVEYSISQDATHVRSLRKVISNNLHNLGTGQSFDYVPIGLFFTREQADRFCVLLRQGIDQDFQGASHSRHNWRRIRDVAEELLPKQLNNFTEEPDE